MSVAFVFPGQGSQFPGMGELLYRDFEEARLVFEESSDILGFDMKELCFGKQSHRLIETAYTQPAVLTIGYALHRIFTRETGISPTMMAGHSLGEWTALVCGQAISFQDGLRLVRERGRIMSETLPGDYRMAAIMGIGIGVLEESCKTLFNDEEIVAISNYNSLDQTVVSGHAAAVDRLVEYVETRKGKAVYLHVQSPFHSPLMEQASLRFKDVLRDVTFLEPVVPVLSTINGRPHTVSGIENRLANQILLPVDWIACMEYLHESNIEQVIEFGPGKSLTNIISSTLPRVDILSLREFQNVKEIRERYMPKRMEEEALSTHRFMAKCLAIAVATQNYGNASASEWTKVVEAYQKMEAQLQRIENENREATEGELLSVLTSLQTIFLIKEVPLPELVIRGQQLQRFPVQATVLQKVQAITQANDPLTV